MDAAGQGVQPVQSGHGRGPRPAASTTLSVVCPECENSTPVGDIFLCLHCGDYICRGCLTAALTIATGVWSPLAEVHDPTPG